MALADIETEVSCGAVGSHEIHFRGHSARLSSSEGQYPEILSLTK